MNKGSIIDMISQEREAEERGFIQKHNIALPCFQGIPFDIEQGSDCIGYYYCFYDEDEEDTYIYLMSEIN